MSRLTLVKGDITTQEVDAIVNAANSSLLGGGGVDGAIHRAGGPSILAECIQIRERQGGCAPGEAVVTGAGDLPARHVVHTVGPIWRGGDRGEAETLASCYATSLALAGSVGARTVAFPSISTGVYGYPKEPAASVAVAAVREALDAPGLDGIEEVRFVVFSDVDHDIYRRLLDG